MPPHYSGCSMGGPRLEAVLPMLDPHWWVAVLVIARVSLDYQGSDWRQLCEQPRLRQ